MSKDKYFSDDPNQTTLLDIFGSGVASGSTKPSPVDKLLDRDKLHIDLGFSYKPLVRYVSNKPVAIIL